MKRTRGTAFGAPRNTKARKRTATTTTMTRIVRSPSVSVTPGYTRTVGRYRRSLPNSLEKKYFDVFANNTAISTTGFILDSLNKVPQGTTDVTRIGNKINITNINFRIAFSLDDAGTGTLVNGHCRTIIYIDKQANGAAAAADDILITTGTPGQTALWKYRNMDQTDRFVILKDKIYSCDVISANVLHTAQGSSRWFKFSKKCDIPIHFSSTTGAITEIRSNNIGMLFVSDISTMNYTLQTRVKFIDA